MFSATLPLALPARFDRLYTCFLGRRRRLRGGHRSPLSFHLPGLEERDECPLQVDVLPLRSSVTSFNFNSGCLDVLEGKLSAFVGRDREGSDDEDSMDDRGRIGVVVAILQDACGLIRDTEGVAPDFPTLVDRVDKSINSAIDYSYNDGELCDFMPSFAHSAAYPELPGDIAGEGTLRMF